MDTVIFHFDPLTGEDIRIVASTEDETGNPHGNIKGADGRWVSVLEGVDVIAGPLIDVFLMPDGKDTIGMLDEFLQVSLIRVVASVIPPLTTLTRSNFTLIPLPHAPPSHRWPRKSTSHCEPVRKSLATSWVSMMSSLSSMLPSQHGECRLVRMKRWSQSSRVRTRVTRWRT